MLDNTKLLATEDDKTGAFAVQRAVALTDTAANTTTKPTGPTLPDPATETTTTTTTTATVTPMVTAPEEETIVLSPFVVDSSKEKGSYMANSTLAGTRVRTDLDNVASALSVVTAQFLQDTGANNNQDLLIYTVNTEVAGLNGNFSGQAGNVEYTENTLTPSTTTRVRGLSAADNTRGYFLTDIPWDSFNVGRIDIQRGPNSILFGVGSPGGIINNDVNDAEFTNKNNVQNRVGNWGSVRDSADFNYVLIPNQLAIRVAWVNDEEKYQQEYAYNNTTRYYGAVRYDPVILGKDNHTSIRVKLEKGTVSSNNPRTVPPTDELTQWFAFGKPLINEWTPGSGGDSSVAASPGQPYASQVQFGGNGGWSEGRTYSQDVLTYYNGVQSNGVASATPSYIESGMMNASTASGYSVGDLPFYRPKGIAPYFMYAANNPAIVGGAYYTDKVLLDPSIFNFYNKLLDGPNEHQWQGWTALNASISQTFFNDRLGFELVYDDQKYNNGQVGYMGGGNYAISVDCNETYTDGSPNPNFGRPFVANANDTGNNSSVIDRNSLRLTGTAELRASDFLSRNSWAERILGRHVLTGLLEEDHKNEMDIGWAENLTTMQWVTQNNLPIGSSVGYRQFDWLDYIGPNLLGDSSASGLNLASISNVIAPGAQSVVRNFNATWNNSNISQTAPFDYYSYTTGKPVSGTQADNPANYVGWQSTSVTWLNASNPADFPSLVTGADKSKFSDLSKGFTWQGYMFDNTFVPTFGWRKDSVVNYQTDAPLTAAGIATTDFGLDPASRREAVGETKAWGAVYHAPKFLTSWLPWGTTVSAFFDHNQNFEAEAPRQDLAGGTLPNPIGKTKEYGITISTMHDKLTFKIDWYRTQVANASLDSTNYAGLGATIALDPAWGYQYAAALQQGLEGNLPLANETGLWNYGWQDQSSGIAGHTGNTPTYENPNDPDYAISQAVVQAWLNCPFTAGFFTAWGSHPNTIDPALAKASGQLTSAFGNTPFVLNGNWYSQEQPGSWYPVTTVDVISRGEEFELSAQPTRNWNITINYARTFATHENVDAVTRAFMEEANAFFAGPGGQLRIWGAGGPPIGGSQGNWFPDVADPYATELASEGQMAPEVSPWRFNLTTTYTFDRGKLKGYFIGGAARLEAGRILGYQYSATLGALDVTKPWIGPNDEYYDLWFGYQRRIFANKINWRIQANLHNLFTKDHLVPAQYEPDGTLALARIQEGMTWQLTNSFDF
jgi:hypothetical protein